MMKQNRLHSLRGAAPWLALGAMRLRRLAYLCALVLLVGSCAEKPLDEKDEDYNALFPFEGISKPEVSFEDMTRMPCDPEMALSAYKYPGVEIDEDARDYVVTLRCLFTQSEGEAKANYSVRYISADKKICIASSNPASDLATDHLLPGQELVKTFTVRSGYPLYLSVSGVAPRGSKISASISARSVDGLVVVPTLESKQSQNKEGPNPIPSPYCEYIILP